MIWLFDLSSSRYLHSWGIIIRRFSPETVPYQISEAGQDLHTNMFSICECWSKKSLKKIQFSKRLKKCLFFSHLLNISLTCENLLSFFEQYFHFCSTDDKVCFEFQFLSLSCLHILRFENQNSYFYGHWFRTVVSTFTFHELGLGFETLWRHNSTVETYFFRIYSPLLDHAFWIYVRLTECRQ